MKKVVAITIIFLVFLCGCGTNSDTVSTQSKDTVSVIMPDNETALTVNGYYIPPENQQNIKYYANINTKKFHLESCRYSTSKNKNNIMCTTDRSRLLKDNYIPCKICKP